MELKPSSRAFFSASDRGINRTSVELKQAHELGLVLSDEGINRTSVELKRGFFD